MTTPSSTTTTRARFLLLGDSHAAVIGRAARAAGIAFAGGPIGSGRDFTVDFFDTVHSGDIRFRDAEADQHYRGFLAELGATGLAGIGAPLVCTFGLSAHFYATTENWYPYRDASGGLAAGFLGSPLFGAVVRAMGRDALAFFALVRRWGLRVLAVLPPQRVPPMSDPAVFAAARQVIARALAEHAIELVDLRATVVDEAGRQRPEFSEANDPIHGNLAFGRLILAELVRRGL